MLEVINLTKRFDGHLAVDAVSFELPAGQLTALIGPNGAGKTTLLDLICGLLPPNEGTVKMDGHDLAPASAFQRAARHISRTFQRVKQTESLTGKQNVQLRFRGQCGTGLVSALVQRSRWRCQEAEISRRADAIMDQLGIADLRSRLAGEMSFGQCKLFSLAGAIAHDGGVMLLDEPCAGLDLLFTERIAAVLRGMSARGKHVLFVEHNLQLVSLIADRVVAMDRGRVIADGTPKDVLGSDTLMRAYTR